MYVDMLLEVFRNDSIKSVSHLECVRKAYHLELTEEPAPTLMAPGGSDGVMLFAGGSGPPHLQGRVYWVKHQDHLSHVFLLFLPNKNIEKIPGDLSHQERLKMRTPLGNQKIQMDFVARDLSFLVPWH